MTIHQHLTQTCKIYPKTKDVWGDETLGTAVNHKCFFEQYDRLVQDTGRSHSVSTPSARAFLKPSVSVELDWEFEYDSVKYRIIKVYTYSNHKEILLE
jgi:hypothetical protein